MEIKRIITTLVGLPLVALVLIFGNKYLVDVTISIIAIMALYEYFYSFKEGKENTRLNIIGYIVAVCISFIHIIPEIYTMRIVIAIIPISILLLFLEIIVSNMKYNIKDIAITFFGICYIVIFLMFIPIIRQTINGRITIWFVFIAAWGTDTFAYCIGRRFGKHKFSQISPNKSIEGCIGGTIGAVICIVIYAIISNNFLNTNFNYGVVTLIGFILSVIGQIGDFAASSIKRYTGIKDFSNLLPGHGGMLDRIDSVIFISPFAYFLLMLL